MKVTKSVSERYFLKDNHLWANITITEDGFVDIQSDYGDYSYRWSAMGTDVKRFLIGCDKDYIMCKFKYNCPDVFDSTGTEKAIIKAAKERKKNGEITKAFLDELLEHLEYTDGWSDESEFWHDVNDHGIYDLVFESSCYVPCEHDTNPQLVSFMKEVWPHFIKQLKKEVEDEQQRLV